ncbi:MAG: Coenzyme F420 hydrogenase/dehydrogenase, beta subunit C-terminal domain [Fastidiosipilaceae bacterium]
MRNGSIISVVKAGLCTGCGTCIAICPKNALSLKLDKAKGLFFPEIDASSCTSCGFCIKVCPGQEVNFPELNRIFFGHEPASNLLGNYIETFVGYSTNYNIRYNATSGGMVTQMLLFALDEGIIDGAVVTRMRKDNPFEPEPFIAKTREEIIEASRSKYCPVPVNVALKEILRSKDSERFAIVGLPCHLQAVRKLEAQNPKLMKKIVLHVGIACSHTPNFHATDFILYQLGVRKEDVAQLSYRGEGWPGKMQVKLKKGLSLNVGNYWGRGFGQGFVPCRCTLCCDHMAEFSDISFADAWLPEIQKNDTIGTSLIICRNQETLAILESMNSRDLIKLEHIAPELAAETQKSNLKFKKGGLNARINLLKIVNRESLSYPDYKQNFEQYSSSWTDYFWGIFLYCRLYLYSKRSLWGLLSFITESKQRILSAFISRRKQE